MYILLLDSKQIDISPYYIVPTKETIHPVLCEAIARQPDNQFYALDRHAKFYLPLCFRVILNFVPSLIYNVAEWEVWIGITNGTFKKYLLGKHR